MPKIQQINKSMLISIPCEFARLKGWKKGDVLVFGTDSRTGLITLEKMQPAETISPDQKSQI